MVLASPITASVETVAYAMQILAERVGSVGFCWLVQLTMNLGLRPLKPINGSISRTKIYLRDVQCGVHGDLLGSESPVERVR